MKFIGLFLGSWFTGVFTYLRTFPLLCIALGRAVAAASSAETTVTSSTIDLFRDGRKETVALVMTEGKKYDDTNVWCGMEPKYEGRFSVVVTFPGGQQMSTALWPGQDGVFFFSGPWKIYFKDYNRDGILDFNLGQYGSCNVSEYTLFSFKPDGKVFEIGHATLGFHDDSTDALQLTKKGYSDGFYNNAIGGSSETFYEWNKAAQTFVPYLQIDEVAEGTAKRRVEKKFNRKTHQFETTKDEIVSLNQPTENDNSKTSDHLPTRYVVRSGDTLALIARKYYGKQRAREGVKAILAANPRIQPRLRSHLEITIPKLAEAQR